MIFKRLKFFGGGGGGGADFPNTGGGGSSRPNKDWRLRGEPNTVNRDGYAETKIGSDGRAVMERHHTTHNKPKYHTNPHDHTITWTPAGKPQFSKPINYQDGNVPDFPRRSLINMEYERNFINAADFLDAMGRGGELEFIYEDVEYTVTQPHGDVMVGIANKEETWIEYSDPVQSLSYPVGNNKTLGDIFAEMKVTFRSL